MMDSLEYLKLIVQVGSFGLVAWLFLQTFRVEMPAQRKALSDALDKFSVALEGQRKDLIGELREERVANMKALELQRVEHTKQYIRIAVVVERIADKIGVKGISTEDGGIITP